MKRNIFYYMNTTNGHDAALVVEINKVFNDKILFWQGLMIVEAISKRDAMEVYDVTGLAYPTTTEVALHLSDILMQVCDNEDLKLILKFVHKC